MKKTYLINTKSNLHVGAGNSNYGVIDNLVQRDPTDDFPTVLSSSLKGSFREFFKGIQEKPKTEEVFGGEDNGRSTFVLSEAHLLGIPVRSNKYPYFMATSPYLLQKFKSMIVEDYKISVSKAMVDVLDILSKVDVDSEQALLIAKDPEHGLVIEDFTAIGRFPEQVNAADNVILGQLQILFGNKSSIVLLSDEDMQYQCGDYALPVLARNSLEDGRSTNLWYEQIVPREAVFYFVLETDGNTHELASLLDNNPSIQVGANASIGYGRCQISKISFNS